MKRILIGFCSFGLLPLFAQSQSCAKPFLGSKTIYTYQQQKCSTAPKGYLPVFINHVGRHGARHLTKAVSSYYIYNLLMQADSLKGLSKNGKLLKEKILRLDTVEMGSYKSISDEGTIEQAGIANRIYINYKNVFKNSQPNFNISYTKEIRTLQTSEAFLNELKTKINKPVISKQINDTILRFYDMSSAYAAFKNNGIWQKYIGQLKDSLHYNEIANQITQQFFTPIFFKKLTKKNRDKFTSNIFSLISIFYSIQNEITDKGYKADELDMQQFLTCDELYILAKIDNAEDYFVKGPGTDVNGIQVKIAAPLLADFINTTDAYIKAKEINAQLRFCHAETISPFAAIMGITNASETTKNILDINKVWNSDKVIQLSANIQWVLYKKGGDEKYLIKFLLNEKEVSINGLSTKTFPYYSWDDVRLFYIKKMAGLDASLNSNFVQYLKDVN
jgi:hypothetical protein